jgi:X-X-X-Leu-X-X-Gly heptad repeat protein
MPISSPCSKVCTIDPRSGLCRGCGRTLGEIGQWASMPEAERRRIMSELPGRMRAAGLGQLAGSTGHLADGTGHLADGTGHLAGTGA